MHTTTNSHRWPLKSPKATVRSLENKLDSVQCSRSTLHEARDCFVFVFTETWLNNNIPDSAIRIHGLSCYRVDRDTALSGKTHGGGLCSYQQGMCRPFYLPLEFTAIVIVVVYVLLCENAKNALCEL
ncbi:Phenoloxidase subunit 1 [Labeo rohita]|uniref:Phenoloxidase subunit 1 n=1 Tax=Labeo rohita TaxID=84645 RepID=A0ABQ8L509_LABRO|nr:Phenoloxidase subunit 1 [Labeo rohita]